MNKIPIYYLLWAAFWACPFSTVAQSQEYQFYNITNAALLEDYYITIFSKDKTNHFYADDEAKVSLDKKMILASDSIYLNANFQQMKISKSSLNTSLIEIELSQDLDEVVVTDKKKLFWIGADNGSKSFAGFETSISVAIRLDDAFPLKVTAIEIPIKGRTLFIPKSYGSKFLIRLYVVDEDMHVINYLLSDDVIYTIQKKGSHQLQIDLRSYNLILDQGKFLIATIKKFNGDIHIKTAEAIKNPTSIKVTGAYKTDSLGNRNLRFKKWEGYEYLIKVRVQLERL